MYRKMLEKLEEVAEMLEDADSPKTDVEAKARLQFAKLVAGAGIWLRALAADEQHREESAK